QAIVKDISLLSMQELSAIMQYPVISVATTSMQVVEESAAWWKIGLLLAGGLLLLVLAWCCLFVYFNTCGRLSFRDRKEKRYEDMSATLERMEETAEKTERIEEKEEMRQDESMQEERQRSGVVVVEAEEKRTPAIEHRGQRANVVEKNEKPQQREAEVKVEERREDEEMKEEEMRRDSVESLEISEEAGDELQDDFSPAPVTSSRPRAAGLRRPMRTMDGRVIDEGAMADWTTFTAGDRVNALFAIRPPSSFEHPTPAPASLNGVVAYSTSQANTAFSRFL
ncbi:hypothetical protein PMAYCL1PPCAC_31369, partial [Pristionchus mayeri]